LELQIQTKGIVDNSNFLPSLLKKPKTVLRYSCMLHKEIFLKRSRFFFLVFRYLGHRKSFLNPKAMKFLV
jgi:hypothetical protein